MKAIRIHSYGGPEVLKYEDAPRPEPQAGEVLIRVHAAGVNPIDWKIRAGHRKDVFPVSFPLILGWDLSGVIEEVGSGATRFKKGDEVFSMPDPTRNGAYAEYIVVRESEVALKPKSLHHIRAAAIPLAALTAWHTLFDTAELQPGQRVLGSRPDGANLAEIANLIDSGKLAPVIDRILPLSEARRAHELSQSGHTHGKIVLRVRNGDGTFERKRS